MKDSRKGIGTTQYIGVFDDTEVSWEIFLMGLTSTTGNKTQQATKREVDERREGRWVDELEKTSMLEPQIRNRAVEGG